MTRKQLISKAMSLLRAIPSEARAEASRINGRKGGRPNGSSKNKKRGGRHA
jgi:hypothetical protein